MALPIPSRSLRAHPVLGWAMLMLGTFFAAACGDSPVDVKPVTVTLSSSTVTVEELGTAQLDATVGGSSAGALTWSSSDPDVATVSASGLVTGVAAGTATVTAAVAGESASAAAAVTVTPLPLAIRIDGFEKDGQAVAADALGLGVSARVVYDLPAGFEGYIEIRAGDVVLGRVEIPEPDAGAASASPFALSEVVVTGAQRAAEKRVPIQVASVSENSLDALVTNQSPISIRALISAHGGAPLAGPGTAATFQLPSVFGITSIQAERSVVDGLGRRWVGGSGIVVLNGQVLDFSQLPADLGGNVRFSLIQGQAAVSLYGAVGADGVTVIDAPDLLEGREGEFSFGATAVYDGQDGSSSTLPVLNAGDFGLPLSPRVFFDFAAPDGALPTDLPEHSWLGPGPLAPQLSAGLGIDGDLFSDGGVGGVHFSFSGGFTPGLELGELSDLDGFLEFAAGMLLGMDVGDDLDNFKRWVLSTSSGTPMQFGYDATGPVATGRVGVGYTPDFSVNPALLGYGADFADPLIQGQPGSGVDVGRIGASVRFRNAAGQGCLLGTYQDDTCVGPVSTYDDVEAAVNGSFAASGYVVGEFTVQWDALDQVGNAGTPLVQRGILDANAPAFASSIGVSVEGPFGLRAQWAATDDLELAEGVVLGQFTVGGAGTIPPVFVGYEALGAPFDAPLVSSAAVDVTADLLRSLEDWSTRTVYPLEVVLGGLVDTGGNQSVDFTVPTGIDPASGSFGDQGVQLFGASASAPVLEVDGTVQVTVVARTTEAVPALSDANLFGSLSPTGNPVPMGEWTGFTVTDLGSERQLVATFVVDAAALGLLPNETLYLWPFARTADAAGIMGSPVSLFVPSPGPGAPPSATGAAAAAVEGVAGGRALGSGAGRPLRLSPVEAVAHRR